MRPSDLAFSSCVKILAPYRLAILSVRSVLPPSITRISSKSRTLLSVASIVISLLNVRIQTDTVAFSIFDQREKIMRRVCRVNPRLSNIEPRLFHGSFYSRNRKVPFPQFPVMLAIEDMLLPKKRDFEE